MYVCVCVAGSRTHTSIARQVIALVYDVTDLESFENIANWVEQIRKVRRAHQLFVNRWVPFADC